MSMSVASTRALDVFQGNEQANTTKRGHVLVDNNAYVKTKRCKT